MSYTNTKDLFLVRISMFSKVLNLREKSSKSLLFGIGLVQLLHFERSSESLLQTGCSPQRNPLSKNKPIEH